MARPATGQVIERKGKAGSTFAIRFRAYGERRYVTLGSPRDGWTQAQAEEELENVLADVRRGLWRPPQPTEPVRIDMEPTFHQFASDWMARRRPELAPKTIANYEWALTQHLLPFFAGHRLSEITMEEVDRYKAAKLPEGRLGANQVNTALTRLAQVLEDAVEYGHVDRNAARGRRRRVKGTKPQRSWVEPEQLLALLEAANRRHRPIFATLAGAGLRAGEAVALNWQDISLATRTLTVRRWKTDAGTGRQVDLPAGLHEELVELKARNALVDRKDPVFVARSRGERVARQTVSNVGRRLKTAIRRANVELVELGIEPISERVTPHSLRRTYASLRFALGDDPVYVADQLGHTEAAFSMEVYAKAVKRRERLAGEHLRRFAVALEWARMGTTATFDESQRRLKDRERSPETAQ